MVGKVLTGNGAYSLIGGDELSHYVTRCCSYIASGRITCSS
jgi:hypothetical protein